MRRDLCLECRNYIYCQLDELYTDGCELFEPSPLPEEREEEG